jgi:hypothetical protein
MPAFAGMSSACVAVAHNQAYLRAETLPMPAVANASLTSRPLLVLAAIAVLLVAATLALWAHYGTAVFFEIIAAGIAACF